MALYDVGDSARLSAAFVDINNNAADPNTITVKYKPPGQSVVTKVYGTDIEVVRDSAGNFHIDLLVSLAGEWQYRWEGTGTVTAAAQNSFTATAAFF